MTKATTINSMHQTLPGLTVWYTCI